MCTWAEVRERESRTPAGRVRVALMMYKFTRPGYPEWCDLVEEAIGLEADELARRRHALQDVGEDGLTAILVIGLKGLGLTASSAVVNGNCDLVVEADDYLWLGEAKIDTGVSKVWGGYLQLTQRYATGLGHQSRGGMLLYCFRDTATRLLAEWRSALSTERPASQVHDGLLPLTFRSSDTVASSGLSIDLLHYAIPLLHDPVEDTEKLSKRSLAAARQAKKAADRSEI